MRLFKKPLTKVIAYQTGKTTENAVLMLKNFSPETTADCIKAVKQINGTKEFLRTSPLQESFTNKI